MRRFISASATIIMLVSWLAGENRLGTTNSSSEAAQNVEEFPTLDLAFSGDGSPVIGFLGSPVMSYASQCSGDGTVFVQMFTPPDFRTRQIYSISSSNEIHQFSTARINDLYDVTVRDTFANDSSVVVLLTATPSDRQGKRTYVFPNGGQEEKTVFLGEHHNHIATFSLDGTYKGRVQVDSTLIPDHVGVFGSGVFVVLGRDPQLTKPVLALLNKDGSLLRFLDLAQEFSNWAESINTHHDPNASASSTTRLSLSPMTQFLAFHDNLLMVEEGSSLPIFELRDSGAIRPIKLKIPDKHVIDTLIPSQDHLYVRSSAGRPAWTGNGATLDSSVLQVNPEDGRTLSRLRVIGATVDEIVCHANGQFIGLRRDEKGGLVRMIGTIAPRSLANQ